MAAESYRVLYVTDPAYEAAGRRYGDEDIRLSDQLRRRGLVPALCHPLVVTRLMRDFDVVVVRNTGPVLRYKEAYSEFRDEASAAGTLVYNPLTGRGDMAGKQYLVELTRAGFPVIPTVRGLRDLDLLPGADEYVVKPVEGADSIGIRFVSADRLAEHVAAGVGDVLVQPRIPFRYEVSFYFVDADFQYALYAPDPARRWELEPYEASAEDLEFARGFVAWNTLACGIQRVDACRAPDGRLLLVELEDLNPYLSLDSVAPAVRDAFTGHMAASVRRLLES